MGQFHAQSPYYVLFFTDNEALVYVINKTSCRDKFLMSFVRRLVLSFLNNCVLDT